MPLDPDRIPSIASRLNKVERGSPEADAAIHHVLGLAGPQLEYTTDIDTDTDAAPCRRPCASRPTDLGAAT